MSLNKYKLKIFPFPPLPWSQLKNDSKKWLPGPHRQIFFFLEGEHWALALFFIFDWHHRSSVSTLLGINAIPNVPIPNTQYPIPNTQKFWSDRKSRFTDILDPKKDTIKHDCFWLKKRYNKTRLFLRKNKIVVFFLSVLVVFYCIYFWVKISHVLLFCVTCVLNVGYTVTFQWQSGKKVLTVGYWVLSHLSVGYWMSDTP